jgi:hypothetical protein
VSAKSQPFDRGAIRSGRERADVDSQITCPSIETPRQPSSVHGKTDGSTTAEGRWAVRLNRDAGSQMPRGRRFRKRYRPGLGIRTNPEVISSGFGGRCRRTTAPSIVFNNELDLVGSWRPYSGVQTGNAVGLGREFDADRVSTNCGVSGC